MPHEKRSPGEIEILIDGESDDVAFGWLLIHLGIHSNPAERPGPPSVEEALAALSAAEKLETSGLVRIGRVEYIDGGPPGRLAPVKHVSELIDVVRQRVVAHLKSGDTSDNWRWLCWVVNTELGDLAARHALQDEHAPPAESGRWDTPKVEVRRDRPDQSLSAAVASHACSSPTAPITKSRRIRRIPSSARDRYLCARNEAVSSRLFQVPQVTI